MSSLARLDHVIYAVLDIEREHARLTEAFPEAWPIGRFWPHGRTSGVALGGLNLELIQPDEPDAKEDHLGLTLVFEPRSLEAAQQALDAAGIRNDVFDKFEQIPELLALRGFTSVASRVPQLICRNVMPTEPQLPFDFFVCDYSEFLKAWLSPSHPRLATSTRVTDVVFGTPHAAEASALLDRLGYAGDVAITFRTHGDQRILEINTNIGPLPWP